jgi:hypothetical protein
MAENNVDDDEGAKRGAPRPRVEQVAAADVGKSSLEAIDLTESTDTEKEEENDQDDSDDDEDNEDDDDDDDDDNDDDDDDERHHPGKLEVDLESSTWDDWDHGKMDSDANRREYPEGFVWDCCDQTGDADGCEEGAGP